MMNDALWAFQMYVTFIQVQLMSRLVDPGFALCTAQICGINTIKTAAGFAFTACLF